MLVEANMPVDVRRLLNGVQPYFRIVKAKEIDHDNAWLHLH
jgi:hypothetical protein